MRDEKPLQPEEIERYARHIILPEVGGPGQQKLKSARVLMVGAGGLGSPVLLYLAAAGVGTLGIVDDDAVSLSNLQRQILHGTSDIGAPKTESAASRVSDVNPHVTVETHAMRLTGDNAQDVMAGYDIIVDGSDNFETRYLVADTAEKLQRPLVAGALGRFDGSLTVLMPHTKGADGTPNPRYRDLFPEAPPPGSIPSCAEAGILGAIAGVLGTLQAVEVLKLITGAGEPLVGKILLYDALAVRFQTMGYKRRS
ncbi:HesA/MoeB/ThiF family protein [Oricola cellulosilytica]|uniref:Molybdopterin-synthase adenylyltransferase n=1 Tax=Oricola cellulosilytica TaxID=1429082 RepID=A0A4V2MP91_9HYPH|nr:molybdopterin-synthase adenylyltransferase MoeB [Oricola cellulosilytica]TCD16742.1 molybdopterin-synthase adenylyltransferase MoeB [Oricola cellulosilytica]